MSEDRGERESSLLSDKSCEMRNFSVLNDDKLPMSKYVKIIRKEACKVNHVRCLKKSKSSKIFDLQGI